MPKQIHKPVQTKRRPAPVKIDRRSPSGNTEHKN